MRQEFLSQQVCAEPIEPLVSPTPKSTKGSCFTYNLIQMLFILQKPFRPPSPEKKREVPVDDPLASLRLIASQIGNEPFPVPWDDTFFQINTELPLMIYNTDLSEFISGKQELNITIIQFFMM